MKIRILKPAYKAPSGAFIDAHYIEMEADEIKVNIDNEEIKMLGVKGFPYNWSIPQTCEIKFISTFKNK